MSPLGDLKARCSWSKGVDGSGDAFRFVALLQLSEQVSKIDFSALTAQDGPRNGLRSRVRLVHPEVRGVDTIRRVSGRVGPSLRHRTNRDDPVWVTDSVVLRMTWVSKAVSERRSHSTGSRNTWLSIGARRPLRISSTMIGNRVEGDEKISGGAFEGVWWRSYHAG